MMVYGESPHKKKPLFPKGNQQNTEFFFKLGSYSLVMSK